LAGSRYVKKIDNRWGNRNAFSLMELIISMGIVSTTCLLVATLYAYAVGQYYAIVNMQQAEQSLLEGAYYLKYFLSQAVKVQCYTAGKALCPLLDF